MALLSAKKSQVVIRDYRAIVEANPNDKDLLYAIGVALLNHEQLRDAQDVVGKVVTLDR